MRRAGRIPNSRQIAIAVADWTLVNHKREDVIVIPHGESVSDFDFRFVAGLPVLMVVNEHDVAIADAIAKEVIAAGSKGCLALIAPAFGNRYGHRLYQSHQ